MQESITSSPKMEVTGKSRTKEVRNSGHSKTNAIKSQTIKLKEIPVCVSMGLRNWLMLASVKRCLIST
jgi:hypothetical protein